jgi:prepilin-type N-terminal cleavage/methylation domain-containing protein
VRPRRGTAAGFTLAEVAITLLIVGIGLMVVLQGLTAAKELSAATHYRKIARDLAQLTLNQVEAGLFWEELDAADERGQILTGSYAEDGHEALHYELAFGDEEFFEPEYGDDNEGGYHDSWQYERERQDRLTEDDDEELIEEPFQKVKVKVTYPQFGERPNSLVLERWIPWKQVYGSEEDSGDDEESDS